MWELEIIYKSGDCRFEDFDCKVDAVDEYERLKNESDIQGAVIRKIHRHKWHDCAHKIDHAPGKSGKYLITHEVYEQKRVDTAQFEHSSNTWFLYKTGDIIHPIAWMTLPSAYDGEGEYTNVD